MPLSLSEDKELALLLMHLVYAGAEITTIAAAGPDTNTGLPGVNGTPRPGRQLVEEVLPGVKMALVNDVNDLLETSHYSGRGWTFQEQLMSNRTIIFTPDGGVFFCCWHSVWSEDTFHDQRPEVQNFSPDRLYLVLSDGPTPALAYDGLLTRYTQRSLTWETDILNAFAGLQSQLEDLFGDGPFLEGIPTAALDFYIIFSGQFSMLKRRAGFPSWFKSSEPTRPKPELVQRSDRAKRVNTTP